MRGGKVLKADTPPVRRVGPPSSLGTRRQIKDIDEMLLSNIERTRSWYMGLPILSLLSRRPDTTVKSTNRGRGSRGYPNTESRIRFRTAGGRGRGRPDGDRVRHLRFVYPASSIELTSSHVRGVCEGRGLYTGESRRIKRSFEPWLSSCRAVEAPSRARDAVEALSRPCLVACRACGAPVEVLSSSCVE
jgi:hypothetical protein